MARDLVENRDMGLRWVPTAHVVADLMTKSMKPTEVCRKLLEDGRYSLAPTKEEAAQEAHLQELRRGQRQRRKKREKEFI